MNSPLPTPSLLSATSNPKSQLHIVSLELSAQRKFKCASVLYGTLANVVLEDSAWESLEGAGNACINPALALGNGLIA